MRSTLCMQASAQTGPEILFDLWSVGQAREVSSTRRATGPGTGTDFSRARLPFLDRVPNLTSPDKSIIQGTGGG